MFRPLRVPGSRITGVTRRYRSASVRRTAVSRGTVEDTTRPDTASKSLPCWPRNWDISRACSSDVRLALVAMRQWSTSSSPANRPTTVWVLPASMVISTGLRTQSTQVQADVEDGGGVRQGADGDEVGAG